MTPRTCRLARRRLQCWDDLTPRDRRLLEAHLAGCSTCTALASRQQALDALLASSLHGVAIPSVVPQVRQRIAAGQSRRARASRPYWAIPLAVITVLLALLFPQALPDGPSPLPVGAAWHLVRPRVQFAVAVDPARPGHLLAGAWGQAYESWNSGQSWSRLAPLPPRLVIRALAVDRSAPNRYLVATLHSIYLSTDGGRHWSLTGDSMPGAMNMFLVQDPHRPATFYVGPSVLWKSSNGGAGWQPAGRGAVFAPNGIQALDVARNGTLVAGIWGGGVAISHNGGITWQRSDRGLAPDVMDVSGNPAGRLWAATDRGIYASAGSNTWRSAGLPARFWATSVLARGRVILAAGDGAVYRTTDNGARWSLAMDGLPLDPYVFGLERDPFHPSRVYAALNSDGIFRSDNEGKTWVAIDQGLPLQGGAESTRSILFRRQGALWITDDAGTDPGLLTVERDVQLAALAPDGASAAYVGGNAVVWAVRVVAAPGGSDARTLLTGTGPLPSALVWSPNASLLAVVGRSSVSVTNLTLTSSARVDTWPLRRGERVLGWTADGRSLLTWDPDGTIVARVPQSGVILASEMGRYTTAPVVAPDGHHLAIQSALGPAIGTWERLAPPSPSLRGCAPLAWSTDSARLLLSCHASTVVVSAAGTILARIPLTQPAGWVSGTHRLLFSRAKSLWLWDAGVLRELIPAALPASSHL